MNDLTINETKQVISAINHMIAGFESFLVEGDESHHIAGKFVEKVKLLKSAKGKIIREVNAK